MCTLCPLTILSHPTMSFVAEEKDFMFVCCVYLFFSSFLKNKDLKNKTNKRNPKQIVHIILFFIEGTH